MLQFLHDNNIDDDTLKAIAENIKQILLFAWKMQADMETLSDNICRCI